MSGLYCIDPDFATMNPWVRLGVEIALALCARIKRRRVGADSGHGLLCRKLTRVRAIPLPPRGAATATTIMTTKGGRNFDNTFQDCCEQRKHCHPAAEAERVSDSSFGEGLAGASPAANSPTRQCRRRHRLFLSDEAPFEKLKGLVPKLTLLPQTVRIFTVR